jgi:predicted phage tail component-like protein
MLEVSLLPYRSAEYFLYNGETSKDYGILHCNIESGMLQEPFLSNRIINYSKIREKERISFLSKDYEPIILPVTMAYEDTFTSDDLRNLARWLDQPYFTELIFSDNLNKVYYAMIQDVSDLYHNGNNQGYISVQFLTNSPYAYSPYYLSEVYTFTDNAAGTVIQFTNNGDMDLKPILYFTKLTADGDIEIINNTNSVDFKMSNIALNEKLYIDNENKIIETDSSVINSRYDDFTKDFLSLSRGVNQLNCIGNFSLQIKYQYKLKQG